MWRARLLVCLQCNIGSKLPDSHIKFVGLLRVLDLNQRMGAYETPDLGLLSNPQLMIGGPGEFCDLDLPGASGMLYF